jgi:hypothetical protein
MRLSIFVLLLACLLPLPSAYADGWSDTKRAFQSAMQAKEWKTREQAFLPLSDYDGADSVALVLDSLRGETNGAVLQVAIKTLGSFTSEGAHAALLEALPKSKAPETDYILMALGAVTGEAGADALLDTLRTAKEPQQRALAALALGEKGLERSVPDLLTTLDSKEWQVVGAASRALATIAWSAWTTPTNPKEGKKPAKPAWWKDADVLPRLADRLTSADGAERGDLITALETISEKDYGWNPEAWRVFAQGKEPDDATLRKRQYPPFMFGIPLYGRRIAIVVDSNVLTDNVHPFTERERLQELCKVPGGRDVPWFKIKTIKEFNAAHVIRGIRDMPAKKQKFEVIFSAQKPKAVFGKLDAASTGKRNLAIAEIEKMPHSNGNDILLAMHMALDSGGAKDSQAWKKGPDEVLCVYASVPWMVEETDALVIGSTIGLKARRRCVRVNAVGVREYAYEMMRLFAELSGGRYVALTQ